MAQLKLIDMPQVLSKNYSTQELAAMQRAVMTLFKKWGISDDQAATLLGDIATRTYARWKKGSLGRLSIDQADRISNLLGIHKALRLLFKDPQRGYQWIATANDAFAGSSALDVMLNGRLTDIMRVRRYLDASRGQW
ncbi:MAG: DUF2384 domain-containing protein [Gammaproteobacteria bacterium]|nr:DUF2384 domain-containing protein [Gammaproteobacteria bacterium]